MTLRVVDKFNYFVAYCIVGIARFVWLVDRISSSTLHLAVMGFVFSYGFFIFNVYRSQLFVYLPNVLFDNSIYSHETLNVLGAKTVTSDKPFLKNNIELSLITAKSYLVVDRKHSKVLAEKDKDLKLASASTTKLMTALVALDIYKPDDVVKISADCAAVESTKAGFPEGSAYKAYDLISAMLIGSVGDAACALAENKIPAEEFIYEMNKKAYTFGMKNTFFTNPIGLDGVDYSHFSTATDLYKLANFSVKNTKLAEIVKTQNFSISSIDGSFTIDLENTNKLLKEIPQSVGIKTGTTVEAKEVLVYEYADSIKDIIIVVMGSDDRFADTKALLSWTQDSYEF